MATVEEPAVPFAFFVCLLQAISTLKPKQARHKNASQFKIQILKTLNDWITELHRRHSPLPPNTTVTFFRLFFPEEDVARRYGIKETKLVQYLTEILSGVSHGARLLTEWRDPSSVGCLGAQVREVVEQTTASESDVLSMHQVDALLTELACGSAFSATSVRSSVVSHRPPRVVLQSLYTHMGPLSAAYLTQIILKDLRPLLYPLPETHYRASLLNYNQKAVSMLSKEDLMKAWDTSGRMLRMYRLSACLEEAAQVCDDPDADLTAQLGVPVQIPKCIKGQSPKHVINALSKSEKIWVETKYDGERAQIHVQVDDTGKSRITIFSKSKRDSTLDRFAVHSVVREALGLHEDEESSKHTCRQPRIKENVILEAEMVAYSDALESIDEFWRIRSLIASTAHGVRHSNTKAGAQMSETQLADASQASLISNASDAGTRHLALVFFDILFLDSRSLLHQPYSYRRALLEQTVQIKPGYAMIAKRTAVPMRSLDTSIEKLEDVFAGLLARHQEGAVIKADESRYCDWNLRWIKLKADYIPGFGDGIDLVLLGAGWDKERARELRVSPSVYTTFYFGALASGLESEAKPRFTSIFTASYGLDRQKLEDLNLRIKSADSYECNANPKVPLPDTPFMYDMPPGLPRPAVLLHTPLVGELYGAGFTVAPHRMYYELRFPRISKVHRTSERPWSAATSHATLQSIARAAVGKDRPHKDVEDWCGALWGQPASPGMNSSPKRRKREEEWAERLVRADGRERRAKVRRVEVDGEERQEEENVPRRKPVDLLRSPSPTKLRALGSMTNVLAGPGSLMPRSSPATVRQTQQAPSPIKRLSSTMGIQSPPPSSPASPAPTLIPLPSRENKSLHSQSKNAKPLLSLPAPASDLLPTPTHTPTPSPESASPKLRYADTALGRFLEKAVVWLIRTPGVPTPARRVSSHHILPLGHQVNSLDAVLIACGWGADKETEHVCEWADRGVVFVEDTDTTWRDTVLRRLLDRRTITMKGPEGKCKPVFVLSMSSLSLEEVTRKGDVEQRAICRLG